MDFPFFEGMSHFQTHQYGGGLPYHHCHEHKLDVNGPDAVTVIFHSGPQKVNENGMRAKKIN